MKCIRLGLVLHNSHPSIFLHWINYNNKVSHGELIMTFFKSKFFVYFLVLKALKVKKNGMFLSCRFCRVCTRCLIFPFFSVSDAIYAFVQPTRQIEATKMVCGTSGQVEEENYSRTDYDNIGEEAENVFVLGVERFEDCVQTVCQPILLLCNWAKRQRTSHFGNYSSVRRTFGQILWECLRVGYHLQFWEGILYTGRAAHRGRIAGVSFVLIFNYLFTITPESPGEFSAREKT